MKRDLRKNIVKEIQDVDLTDFPAVMIPYPGRRTRKASRVSKAH